MQFRTGDHVRFGQGDYEVIDTGPFSGRVKDLKTGQVKLMRWRAGGVAAVKLNVDRRRSDEAVIA